MQTDGHWSVVSGQVHSQYREIFAINMLLMIPEWDNYGCETYIEATWYRPISIDDMAIRRPYTTDP